MLKYIAGRAFSGALTVLGAIVLLFLLSLLIPGDLARTVLGPQASLEAVEWYRQQLGLNLPVHERLLHFLTRVAAGDFGIDVITGRPIRAIVLDALPNTASLAFGAIGLAVAIGIPLGAYSATHPGKLADQILAILSVGMIAVPSFVVAVLLVLIFAIWLPVLPVLGITTDPTVGATLARLVLPCFALAIGWIGYIARLVRSSLLEVLGEP